MKAPLELSASSFWLLIVLIIAVVFFGFIYGIVKVSREYFGLHGRL